MANLQTNLEGGAKPIDWTGGINPNWKFAEKLTKEQVLNKTLSDYRASLPKNDGDGAIKQTEEVVAPAKAQSKSPTKSGVSIFRKLAGAYNKNLIVAVVLVGGYFAYKKFKK